jgi:hypothetical protein
MDALLLCSGYHAIHAPGHIKGLLKVYIAGVHVLLLMHASADEVIGHK